MKRLLCKHCSRERRQEKKDQRPSSNPGPTLFRRASATRGSSSVAGPFSPVAFLLSSVCREVFTTFPPAHKEPRQIIFEFVSLQQFGSVTVHAYMNSSGVTWFGSVEVSVSQNKGQWNTLSFETDDRQGPQDITIQTQMDRCIVVEGRYVCLIFGNTQGSGPMLISEVSFNSTVGEFVGNSLF